MPYAHPYGGTAVDQEVTAECFARAFGYSDAATVPTDMKVGDKTVPGGEILGYVRLDALGARQYVVTMIARR